MQLTAAHKVATPADWKQGEDVIIAGSVSDEEAQGEVSRLQRGHPLPARDAAAAVGLPVSPAGRGGSTVNVSRAASRRKRPAQETRAGKAEAPGRARRPW